MLGTDTGSQLQNRHGLTKASAAHGHKANEGTGAFVTQEEAEKDETVQPGENKRRSHHCV